MATVTYQLRSNSQQSQIYVRLSLNRNKDYRRKTGLFINPKDWSTKNKLPKQNKPENKNLAITLKNLETYILNSLNRDNAKGIEVNGNWLQLQIDTFFNRIKKKKTNNYVTDFVQYVIDNAKTQVLPNGKIGLSDNRIKGLKTFKNTLQRFEKHIGKRIKFSNIDYSFETRFRNWLLKDQQYKTSYASKNIDNLKSICNKALKEGKEVHPHATRLQAFTDRKDQRIIQTLSKDELERIEQLELNNLSLDNARKYIIIGSYTGLRYSDLIRLKAEHIFLHEDYPYIAIHQKKTDRDINTPILPPVMRIIEKGLPYPVSYQKLNEQIKQVCKLAGIDEMVTGDKFVKLDNGKHRKIRGIYPKYELISTHTFRRSFATNYYKKMPTPVLMEITGHKRESTFLAYINQTKDQKDNMKLFYEHLEKHQSKPKTKTIQLQAVN